MKGKISFKRYFILFLIAFVIIILFTIADYMIHSLSAEYAVPPYYFRNKIIFGTLLGFAALIFLGKLEVNYRYKALLLSAVISALLQIRYYIEGYPAKFVFEFLFLHFIILLVVSWIVLKFFNKVNKKWQ